jgi:hypothetical protein
LGVQRLEEKKSDPDSWKAKTLNNLVIPESGGILHWAHQAGELMRRLPFDPEQLEVHVSNKIKLLDVARESNQSFLGKFWNKIAGIETEKIELDGIVIKQLHEIIGEPVPSLTDPRGSFKMDHQIVRSWYSKAFPDRVGKKGKKYF